jgi:hypothetical protein
MDDRRPADPGFSILLGRGRRHADDEPRRNVGGRPLLAGGEAVLRTGDTKFLAPFAGKGVRDVNGRFYPFELDENTLYELDHRDEAVVPEQYRIHERVAT